MSELRKQLETEKAAYRAARYDGDLAADVMGSRWASAWWLGPVMGLAAAVVIAVMVWPRGQGPVVTTTVEPPQRMLRQRPATVTTTQVAPVEDSIWSLPAMPSLSADHTVPDGESLTVPAVAIADVGGMPSMGGMPSFPSFSEVVTAANEPGAEQEADERGQQQE